MKVSRKIEGCLGQLLGFEKVSREFKEVSRVFRGSFKGVLRGFQGSFKEVSWVF